MLSDPDSPEHIPSADRRDRILESRDEYQRERFWVPAAARWDVLLRDAKQATIWQTIDAAMDLVEKENPSLKGSYPRTTAAPTWTSAVSENWST